MHQLEVGIVLSARRIEVLNNVNYHHIKTHDSESRGQEEAAVRDE